MDKYMIILIIMTLFIIISNIMIVYTLQKKDNNNNNISKSINTSLSFSDVMNDLNLLVALYINDYKVINKINNGEIFMNSERINTASKNISKEIINSLSPDFKRRLNLFINDSAIMLFITHTVVNNISNYAIEINTPK